MCLPIIVDSYHSDALPLFSIEVFLRFSFFNYFYVHFHFFIVEFSLFWNDLQAENAYWLWAADRDWESADNYFDAKFGVSTAWRYMENANKFNFREQTKMKCDISLKFIIENIFNFGRLKWYLKVDVNLYRRLMDEEKSCIRRR